MGKIKRGSSYIVVNYLIYCLGPKVPIQKQIKAVDSGSKAVLDGIT